MKADRYYDILVSLVGHRLTIVDYELIHIDLQDFQGAVEMRLFFYDESFLHFREFFSIIKSQPVLEAYAYQYCDARSNEIIRWDDAPHHPHLPNFPYHVHEGERVRSSPIMNLKMALDWIEQHLL